MPKRKIIDSHMHLWDVTSQKTHPWLNRENKSNYHGDYSRIAVDYFPEDYRKDAQDFPIESAVFVQAGWDSKDLLGEVEWVNHVNDGLISAIVPYANLAAPNAAEQLEQLAQFPLVHGIRQIVAWHDNPFYQSCERDFLSDETWQGNFKLLAQHDFSFDLQIYPHQTEAAYALLQAHPNTPVVIEHFLQPLQHDAHTLAAWKQAVKKLSALPNAYIKLSGMNLFDHTFNLDSLTTLFQFCVDTFGAHRCMTGSNFPVEKLYTSFGGLYTGFFEAAGKYSEEEQNALFYETARQFYKIP